MGRPSGFTEEKIIDPEFVAKRAPEEQSDGREASERERNDQQSAMDASGSVDRAA